MSNAIFFDLDGTLWDALIPLRDSYNLAMEKHGLHYRFDLDKVKSFMGLTPEETAVLVFNDVDLKTGLEYFYICLNAELEYLKVNPGKLYENEEEVLKSLSTKYDLYVLSNADKGYIEKYVDGYNFRKYFKGFLCAGDTGLDKKENIVYLKNKNNIDRVIYVGDTYKDMIQSKEAGVEFIHASYGFGKIENPPHKISSLLELESTIKEIFKD